ncbi:hypothetical protein ASZ90_011150 [hydrocarbon metagenome]|uniref:Uncharacterized protein n=1 Tax=hydrocarbon metagenome TaxID=938273 RepID=A0A0W8FE57_9ZZZZ
MIEHRQPKTDHESLRAAGKTGIDASPPGGGGKIPSPSG